MTGIDKIESACDGIAKSGQLDCDGWFNHIPPVYAPIPTEKKVLRYTQLEKQLCTVEQGRRLVALGVKWGRSYFSFYLQRGGFKPARTVINAGHRIDKIPAFTVAELGIMLPPSCNPERILDWSSKCFDLEKTGRWWFVARHPEIANGQSANSTEATARASYLIYLLENGLIEAQDVNARLAAA